MGSAKQSKLSFSGNEKLVSVRTAELKERLNRLYTGLRSGGRKGDMGRFDYLWDLKELALMEGRPSVEVPETWLEEIEKGISEHHSSRGH